jgi:hypothetical protein
MNDKQYDDFASKYAKDWFYISESDIEDALGGAVLKLMIKRLKKPLMATAAEYAANAAAAVHKGCSLRVNFKGENPTIDVSFDDEILDEFEFEMEDLLGDLDFEPNVRPSAEEFANIDMTISLLQVIRAKWDSVK